jgi:ribosomal protein S18 acetylase RimI-like enzyme
MTESPHPSDLPPAGISIRPAEREDETAIRAMVRAERLNPMNIHWRNFLVAEDAARRIVGIGQVKTHRDGSRELASIATAAEWRKRGVASAVIRALLARESSAPAGDESSAPAGENRGPLYLMCRDALTGFYEPLGFREIGLGEMPPYFRRTIRFLEIFFRIVRAGRKPVVMKRDEV